EGSGRVIPGRFCESRPKDAARLWWKRLIPALCEVLNPGAHGLHDSGRGERMTGAFDHPHLRIAPASRERMGGGGRAQEIEATLHDESGNARKALRVLQELAGREEAIVQE